MLAGALDSSSTWIVLSPLTDHFSSAFSDLVSLVTQSPHQKSQAPPGRRTLAGVLVYLGTSYGILAQIRRSLVGLRPNLTR